MEPFEIASLALGGAGFLGNFGQSIFGNRANRNFQAQQAQIARDWQEDFYNKYSSPSAMVQQFKDAGLNPAMMYGRGASVVGGVPSGASPAGGSQMQSDLSGLMNMIPSIVQMKEMIKNNESLRHLQSSQANMFDSESSLNKTAQSVNSSIANMNNKQVDWLAQRIDESKQNVKSLEAKRLLDVAQQALYESQKSQVDYKNAISEQFEKTFGYKADAETINTIMSAVASLGGSIFGGIVDAILSKFGLKRSNGLSININQTPGK